MNKERAKEVFEKFRSEQPEYVMKPISENPSEPGTYNIQLEGVRTIAPMFAKFDGKNWVDLSEAASFVDNDMSKISYYEKKMRNMENIILAKCGWDSKQLGFLGTMVHNVTKGDGSSIADIVSSRTPEQVSVEWFTPDQEGNKIALVYSLKDKKIVEDKTDSGIRTEKDLNAFLENIQNTINGVKGNFFPKAKLTEENKNKPSI